MNPGTRASAAGPPTKPPFWKEHRDLIQAIGVGVAILGVIITAGIWWLTGGGDDGASVGPGTPVVTTDSSPDNVIEQIAQRPFWVRPPETYEAAARTFRSDNYDADLVELDVYGGVPVLDSRDLVDNAADYDDRPVFIIGRVVRVRSVDDRFDLQTEYELAPSRGTVAYVGDSYLNSTGIEPEEGEVIYAFGQLAAVGEARETGDPAREAVYFLTAHVEFGGGANRYEPGIFEIDSKSLTRALDALVRKRR